MTVSLSLKTQTEYIETKTCSGVNFRSEHIVEIQTNGELSDKQIRL